MWPHLTDLVEHPLLILLKLILLEHPKELIQVDLLLDNKPHEGGLELTGIWDTKVGDPEGTGHGDLALHRAA
jgi:hypothetical protein